jgi:hypothetical protein
VAMGQEGKEDVLGEQETGLAVCAQCSVVSATLEFMALLPTQSPSPESQHLFQMSFLLN